MRMSRSGSFRYNIVSVTGVFALAAAMAMALFAQQPDAPPAKKKGGGPPPATFSPEALTAFTSLEPIDSHVHVFVVAPAFQGMLDKLHMHLLDILVVDNHRDYQAHIDPMRTDAMKFVESSNGHAKLCTTWSPYKFDDKSFAKDAIKQLNEDFKHGAIAVKIWKNVGMDVKNAAGKYILPDDPKFEPIYKDIASHNKTLIAHLAEPDAAWNPVEGAPYAGYYRQNPQWNMTTHPGAPPKQAILDARDHLLAMNPKLRVVGAHLGSMEADVDQIAARLDKYPNFAVDTAARVLSLEIQPTEKVKAFILKYQDRILYGTDEGFHLEDKNPEQVARGWESVYARDWRFFATSDKFQIQGGREVQGLALPHEILKKLYHDNAVRWIPGIYTQAH
jgi:predicted TIM-barrel fold metal-dependent hydrolase